MAKQDENISEESEMNEEFNYLNDIKNEHNKSGNEYYIPSFNSITGMYGPTCGVMFGLIFRLSKKYGHSVASVRYLSGIAGISPSSAGNAIKELLDESLIIDVTPIEEKYWKKGGDGIKKQVRYYVYNPEKYKELIEEWRKSPKNPESKAPKKSSLTRAEIEEIVKKENEKRKKRM